MTRVRRLLRGAVLAPGGLLDPGWVRIEGELIAGLGAGVPAPAPGELLEEMDGLVLPGLVDLHCHGGGGGSFSDAQPDSARRAAEFHRRAGTTTLWASLVTAPVEELVASLAMLRELVADGLIAGVHLEGPFLSARRCGAQNPAHLLAPDRRVLARLLEAGEGTVRMVTLAPELPGALELVGDVVAAGALAAVGHTDATYEQTRAAIDAGASVATHLYNGMRPLHHRDPGPVVALANDAGVRCELIADGHHLPPAILEATTRCLGSDRTFLVTDAISAAGMPEGRYRLGGLDVEVSGGSAHLVGGGSLAGSTITAFDGLAFARRQAGLPLARAVGLAAVTPGRLAGGPQSGTLVPGARADLVACSRELERRAVMIGGAWLNDRARD